MLQKIHRPPAWQSGPRRAPRRAEPAEGSPSQRPQSSSQAAPGPPGSPPPAKPRPPPSPNSRTPVLAPADLSTSSLEDVSPRRALPAQSGSPRPGAPQNAASSPATGRSLRKLLLPACLRFFLTTPPRRHRDQASSESEFSCSALQT